MANHKKLASISVPNQRQSASKTKKTAQDIQDEIFRKMSADKKIELWSKFWQLARDLSNKKWHSDYGANRPKASFDKYR